ncbi:MAG: magnesium transporter CorA family protein [Alphaproteobacteria bacterium]
MIHIYLARGGAIERLEVGARDALPTESLWLDVLRPTEEERARIEAAYGLQLPSPEEMREIEPSSRLYVEGDSTFMTATVLSQADGPRPVSDAITFILVRRTLITLRHTEPRPLAACAGRLMRQPAGVTGGEDVFITLLDAFVDRLADLAEKVGAEIDRVSAMIFGESSGDGDRRDLQNVITALGRNEDLASAVRESLLTLTRLTSFHVATFDAPTKKEDKDMKVRVRSLQRDINSLSEHVAYESHKINFLLDATLGLINIDQNRIIKIFSIVAVIFLPPTLVASMYGMNFHNMPELSWEWGYPAALFLMIVSAIVPLIYFRRKKWF